MTRWVLDNGPLVLLARLADEHWSWPGRIIEVVREVAAEAEKDWHGRRLLRFETQSTPWIAVHDLPADGEAGRFLFCYLRSGSASATKDLGEDASIAFCRCVAPDAVFVSLDNNATYTALSELGPGRVATPFDLWHDLYARQLIPLAAYERLMEATLKKRQNLPGIPGRLRAKYRSKPACQ